MSKPSILITNLSLCARTGSELHVLELARQFKASGWEVTCFTLVYAYPLKREFEASEIEVVEFGSEELLHDHYDVLFAQHHVVSEHIWNIGRISFGTVLISILGIVDQQEGLPSFWNNADGFVFVSEETRSKVCDSYAIDVPTLVFPNYAPKQFFSSMERDLPESPHRIAVFSNHPPEEILSLSSCHVSGDPTIDIFGTQTISVELTPQLLEQYDVVVSIGRTAQCCLALGIPFFCYDHFGGPGFILPDNLERHAWYNFSGRSEQKKLGAAELLLAIETGYDSARSSSAELKTRAEDLFSLDRLFRELLIFISKCSCAHDFRGRIASPPTYEDALISVTRCTDFITGYAPSLGTAELFYTSREGNDSSEALESIRLPYRYGSEIQIDIAHLIPDEKELIRFDPDDRGVLCQAKQCNKRLSPFNALLSEREGFDVFLTSDPMYFVSSKEPLFFSARPVSADEALSLAGLTMDSLIHPQQPMVTTGRFSRLKGLLHKK